MEDFAVSAPPRCVHLGVVTDDLTGAGDAGAALARWGWPTLIVVDSGQPVPVREARLWPAVIMNTETRHATPAEAIRRTAAACRWVRYLGVRRTFKKVDSTLRGHAMQESLAGARAVHAERIPYVPAFPKAGRTTVGGVHLVGGRPVAGTFAGRDPRAPVHKSHLPTLIQERLGRDARRFEVPLTIVTTGDLQRVAWTFRHDRYAAGSAGFLAALLPYWAGRARRSPNRKILRRILTSHRLTPIVVSGSATEVARRQVAAYRQRFPSAPVVAAPARRGDPGRVMARLVRLTAAAVRHRRPVGLILTGGETAFRVATRLGIQGLAVREALAPGVAGCEAVMATNGWTGVRVVLKPGGFGGDDILIRARRWIAG